MKEIEEKGVCRVEVDFGFIKKYDYNSFLKLKKGDKVEVSGRVKETGTVFRVFEGLLPFDSTEWVIKAFRSEIDSEEFDLEKLYTTPLRDWSDVVLRSEKVKETEKYRWIGVWCGFDNEKDFHIKRDVKEGDYVLLDGHEKKAGQVVSIYEENMKDDEAGMFPILKDAVKGLGYNFDYRSVNNKSYEHDFRINQTFYEKKETTEENGLYLLEKEGKREIFTIDNNNLERGDFVEIQCKNSDGYFEKFSSRILYKYKQDFKSKKGRLISSIGMPRKIIEDQMTKEPKYVLFSDKTGIETRFVLESDKKLEIGSKVNVLGNEYSVYDVAGYENFRIYKKEIAKI